MDPATLEALGLGPGDTSVPAVMDYPALLGYVPPSAPPPTPLPPPSEPSPQLAPIAGPITQPSQTSPDDPSQLPPSELTPLTNQKFGISQKTSVSGFSPAAYQAIQKGPGSALDKKLAADQAQAAQSYAPLAEQLATAAHEAIDATGKTSELEAQKALVVGEAKRKIQAAHEDFAVKEQAAYEISRAEAQSSMAAYRTALADYAASKVNPSDLWDHAGAQGQVGMLATAFAHDFLGAKGIKTSGMDTINQAIKNNIDAQLANIAAKRNVAEGFRTLWDMQRAQSSSDAEARKRMQGFYLSALSNEVEAKLSQYDSKLALAQGQVAKSKILEQLAKNNLDIQKDIDTAANQRATNDVHAYAAQLSAASARYSADAHLEAAKIAAGAREKNNPLAGLLLDTSKSGENRAIRRFLPSVRPERMEAIQKEYDNMTTTNTAIQTLIDAQQNLTKAMPTGDVALIEKMQNEGQRAAEQLRTIIRTNLLYDSSGKAINEQEMKNFDRMVAKNDWWTNGDNVRNLAILAKSRFDKVAGEISGTSYELSPSDPAYGFKSGKVNAAPAETTLFNIESQPGSGKPPVEARDKFAQWASSPNSLEAYDLTKLPKEGPGNQDQVAKDWLQARAEGVVTGGYRDRVPKQGPFSELTHNTLLDAVTAKNPNNPDRAFINLERLADLAIGGDKKAEELIHELAEKDSSTVLDTTLKAYARWEEGRIDDERNGKLPPGEPRRKFEE